jgi:hypothetical protein
MEANLRRKLLWRRSSSALVEFDFTSLRIVQGFRQQSLWLAYRWKKQSDFDALFAPTAEQSSLSGRRVVALSIATWLRLGIRTSVAESASMERAMANFVQDLEKKSLQPLQKALRVLATSEKKRFHLRQHSTFNFIGRLIHGHSFELRN